MLCGYGCGSEANFVLKNGKHCCSHNWNHCVAVIERKTSGFKKLDPWNKGLNKETDVRVQKHAEQLKGGNFGFRKNSKHSEESKSKIASAMRGNNNGKHRGDRQSYYQNIRMDSSWEVKVAEYLDQQGIVWSYGQQVFVLDEKRSYRPDFILENGTIIEVKGYWRKANLDKFNEWKGLYPNLHVEIWDKTKLRSLGLL